MNVNKIPNTNWAIYADHNFASFPIIEQTTPDQLGNDAMLTPDGAFVKQLIQFWNPQDQCAVPMPEATAEQNCYPGEISFWDFIFS